VLSVYWYKALILRLRDQSKSNLSRLRCKRLSYKRKQWTQPELACNSSIIPKLTQLGHKAMLSETAYRAGGGGGGGGGGAAAAGLAAGGGAGGVVLFAIEDAVCSTFLEPTDCRTLPSVLNIRDMPRPNTVEKPNANHWSTLNAFPCAMVILAPPRITGEIKVNAFAVWSVAAAEARANATESQRLESPACRRRPLRC